MPSIKFDYEEIAQIYDKGRAYSESEQEFNKGLQKAETYFSKRPLPKVWKTEPISVIVATKNIL